MEWLYAGIDWQRMLMPETPVLETIIRGSAIYLGLFIMLRVILNRQAGNVSLTDMLVIVIIADAAQNGMADDYHSIPDGLLLVAVIIFWSYAMDWLGYHFKIFEKLVHPDPLTLVKNGKILHDNMRRELVTRMELMSILREQGVQDIRKVKRACLEGNGVISVVTED